MRAVRIRSVALASLAFATALVTVVATRHAIRSAPGSKQGGVTLARTVPPVHTVPLVTGARPGRSPGSGTSRAAAGVNLGGAANSTFSELTPRSQTRVMADIASSGISWLRVDVPFATEEPAPGQYRWTVADEISRAVAAGLEVDAVIDYPPAWATQADGAPDPTVFAAFAAAATRALSALGVKAFEVGNEPNLARYWGSPVSPTGYAHVLIDTDAAIHRIDPGAEVIAGGLAETTTEGRTAMSPLAFLNALYTAGIHGHFDALADHPYTYPDRPAPAETGNAFAVLADMRSVMVAHGDAGRQIWLTEYGAPTAGAGSVSPTAQAEMITDAFTVADTRDWIGPVFIFDWQDDAADGAFGLTTDTGRVKPSYNALVHLLGRA